MQNHGIVMETYPEFAIVLTREGQFCKIPSSKDLVVGAEVLFDSKDVRTRVLRPYRRLLGWKSAAAAIAAACMMGGVTLWQVNSVIARADAYAYVSLEINPSVSLTINRHYHVLSAVGNDADGDALVKRLHLKGEMLRTAVTDIVNAAVDNHMLPSGDRIIVAAAPAVHDASAISVKEEALSDVGFALSHNLTAKRMHETLVGVKLPQHALQAAFHAKLSPGVVGGYLVAKHYGLDVHHLTKRALHDIFVHASNEDLKTIVENVDTSVWIDAIGDISRSQTEGQSWPGSDLKGGGLNDNLQNAIQTGVDGGNGNTPGLDHVSENNPRLHHHETHSRPGDGAGNLGVAEGPNQGAEETKQQSASSELSHSRGDGGFNEGWQKSQDSHDRQGNDHQNNDHQNGDHQNSDHQNSDQQGDGHQGRHHVHHHDSEVMQGALDAQTSVGGDAKLHMGAGASLGSLPDAQGLNTSRDGQDGQDGSRTKGTGDLQPQGVGATLPESAGGTLQSNSSSQDGVVQQGSSNQSH